MPSLPFELVESILCRLPVKPLKRFRCVAKSWRSLIDSARFVKLHLKTSLKTNAHRHLVVGNTKSVFTVNLDNEDPVMARSTAVKPPFSRKLKLSSSCNGLFLVLGDPLIIWNPFSKEIKKLPGIGNADLPSLSEVWFEKCYGFGYDSRNDDYKVLRVLSFMNRTNCALIASVAHIYSLKSNSWREIAEKFTYPLLYNWPTYVNGALHTLHVDFSPDKGFGLPKIMAFSIESERHYEVKLSLGYSMKHVDVTSVSLSRIGGCLSLNYAAESGFEIWVMKDYGDRESWIKILSIPRRQSMSETDDDTVRPLVYSKDGYKVLIYLGRITEFSYASSKSNEMFFWYDLRNQTLVNVPLKGLPLELNYFDACGESLVSLHAEQVMRQVHVHDKDKKIRKKRDDFLSTGFKLVL